LEDGWKYGDEVILMPKLVEPPGETKSDYQIAAELADRFNMKDRYTEGKSERDWIDWAIVRYQMTRFPGLPDLDQWEAENTGVYSTPVKEPEIAFSEFREDPHRYPLNTPSGKIELFSERLLEMNDPDHIPAVPKYIQEWESPFGPEVNKYPLQALGHHYMGRVHSTHANNSWTNEAFPHVCFINPIDAKNRALRNGDRVKVYNDRGALLIPCRITRKIRPGVVDIPQGAWWDPDEEGNDLGGNINVLTSERWTPLAFGNAQHTIMVEIKKHNSIA
jgi:anaerobic dimethyl sulfoxide reductase subunit A